MMKRARVDETAKEPPSTIEDTPDKGDASTQGSSVGSECLLDYSNEFTNHEIFKSRDALLSWTREVGKRNGFVVVIRKSDGGGEGKRARIKFGCERSGHYTLKERRTDKERQRRRTGTKKCGCPFELKGMKMGVDDDWMVQVVCGVHNHPATKQSEGHSYAGRLSEEETSLLRDLSKSKIKPKEILHTLKQRDALNTTTLKTIYNARRRYKIEEKAGKSQIQQLMCKLTEHDYIEWHRSCDTSDAVKDLFWAHPVSIDMLRAFPHVLMMDCTHKTNMNHLPLLEIVGVTSTDLTFSVAFAYLESEKEDNYVWALTKLRILLEDCCMPSVIVTDRDLSLINATERIFPTARNLLCRWHISRNVLTKCKKLFESEDKWDKFITVWNILVLSNTEDEYNKRLHDLDSCFSGYPDAVDYVRKAWLNTYKEKFVAVWTDTCMHFGNTTLNRAESTHAKLKRHLGSSQGSFETSWTKIRALLESQHSDVKASFEKSLMVVQLNFKDDEFRDLRGLISTHAMNIILAETKRANSVGVDAVACGCAIRHTHGLPCAHEIAEYKQISCPIPLDCINPHWRKLDMVYTSLHQDMRLNCMAEMDLVLKRFMENDNETKLHIIKKLKEIANPESNGPTEPKVEPQFPGCSVTEVNTTTHHDPSTFELILSAQRGTSPDVIASTGSAVKLKPKRPPLEEHKVNKRGDSVDEKIRKLDVELSRYKEMMDKTRPGPSQEAVKARAIRVLKQKRMYEDQRNVLYNQIFNLDQDAFADEGMKDPQRNMSALKSANKELKGMMEIVNIQDVDSMQDDMMGLMDVSNEIQESLGTSYNVPDDIDEEDLMDGLDALEEESESDEVPSYLQPDKEPDLDAELNLPTAPGHAPVPSSRQNAKVVDKLGLLAAPS